MSRSRTTSSRSAITSSLVRMTVLAWMRCSCEALTTAAVGASSSRRTNAIVGRMRADAMPPLPPLRALRMLMPPSLPPPLKPPPFSRSARWRGADCTRFFFFSDELPKSDSSTSDERAAVR